MPTLKHVIYYFQTYRLTRKPLYILCLMLLFWAIYEGIISYITPLVLTENGMTPTLMGIVIGSSSIAGALFDFIACRLFKSTYYKRLFMIMLALCLVYPLILYKANTLVVYLIAMSIWGVYYDLKNIANLDYVGRFTKQQEHSESFGLIQVFQSIGFLIAPIIVGFLVADTLDWKPFAMAWIFLAIAIFFFIALTTMSRKRTADWHQDKHCATSIWREVFIWNKIGNILFPVLVLTLFLNFIDAFFWTTGPLFAESLSGIHQFAGFFMTAYSLPPLLVGWIVGTFTRKYGKKRTAFVSLLVGSVFLSILYFFENPIFIIADIFIASTFISMSWPAINGAYADYIKETAAYEKEIEGLEDFYTNLGYIIGPMLAGFLADKLGNAGAFSLLGCSGFVASIVLLLITPRKINVNRELKKSA